MKDSGMTRVPAGDRTATHRRRVRAAAPAETVSLRALSGPERSRGCVGAVVQRTCQKMSPFAEEIAAGTLRGSRRSSQSSRGSHHRYSTDFGSATRASSPRVVLSVGRGGMAFGAPVGGTMGS